MRVGYSTTRMIDGRHAVVVDYKFGERINDGYNSKVRHYVKLLEEMGLYDRVEGYVWYVTLNHVDKV